MRFVDIQQRGASSFHHRASRQRLTQATIERCLRSGHAPAGRALITETRIRCLQAVKYGVNVRLFQWLPRIFSYLDISAGRKSKRGAATLA